MDFPPFVTQRSAPVHSVHATNSYKIRPGSSKFNSAILCNRFNCILPVTPSLFSFSVAKRTLLAAATSFVPKRPVWPRICASTFCIDKHNYNRGFFIIRSLCHGNVAWIVFLVPFIHLVHLDWNLYPSMHRLEKLIVWWATPHQHLFASKTFLLEPNSWDS